MCQPLVLNQRHLQSLSVSFSNCSMCGGMSGCDVTLLCLHTDTTTEDVICMFQNIASEHVLHVYQLLHLLPPTSVHNMWHHHVAHDIKQWETTGTRFKQFPLRATHQRTETMSHVAHVNLLFVYRAMKVCVDAVLDFIDILVVATVAYTLFTCF